MKNLFYVFLRTFTLLVSCKTRNEQWESLIKNGLSNWAQLYGHATYELIDGVIVKPIDVLYLLLTDFLLLIKKNEGIITGL